jgi:hypothetical protein
MKKLLLLVLSIFCVCVGTIIVTSSQEPKKRVPTPQEREEKRRQRQRSAREVYRGMLDPDKEKIPDAVAKWDRDLNGAIEIGLPGLIPFSTPPTAQQVLHDRSCDVDAVVIAVVRSQTARLTEDETSIFTINEMNVRTVLKDNAVQPIKTGDHINVLRTGGTLEVRGRKVTTVYHASLPLETERAYLLFVMFVPEKGVYVADSISYELRNGKIVSLRQWGDWERELKTGYDAGSFISLVRDAIAAPCDD